MDRPTQFPAFFYAASQATETLWHPPVDVYRTRSGWLLKFDLAGVSPEDILVEARGCRITVSGLRRDWALEEGCTHYSMEIAYNRFERTVELPCDLANPTITLEHKEGILVIRVHTAEEGR